MSAEPIAAEAISSGAYFSISPPNPETCGTDAQQARPISSSHGRQASEPDEHHAADGVPDQNVAVPDQIRMQQTDDQQPGHAPVVDGVGGAPRLEQTLDEEDHPAPKSMEKMAMNFMSASTIDRVKTQ